MADVLAAIAILVGIGGSYPGLMLAYGLLFPRYVGRAALRLEATPWRCFWLGLFSLGAASLPIVILLALPGPGQALGWIGVLLLLAISGLGGAGLVQRLSAHWPEHTPPAARLRAAVVIELAAGFPLLGWFVFLPLSLITVFGATLFALLGWMPRSAAIQTPVQTAPLAGEQPLAGQPAIQPTWLHAKGSAQAPSTPPSQQPAAPLAATPSAAAKPEWLHAQGGEQAPGTAASSATRAQP